MTKTRLFVFLGMLILLILPVSVLAYEVKANISVYVGTNEKINGSLYAGAQTITIDGTVEGDVICGALLITVNGTVEGDVICGAQNININGEVKGNVRVAGDTISINGQVGRNVNAFGATIVQGAESTIGGELFLAGVAGEIRGTVSGDVHGAAASLIIAGTVNGDIKMRLDERGNKEHRGLAGKSKPLVITDGATISGNVYYVSGSEGEISEQASIGGEIGYSLPDKKEIKNNFIFFGFFGALFGLFSTLVVGLVLISLWRKELIVLTDRMIAKHWPAIGRGVILMFVTPLIAVLLIITLIGIPLSLIMLGILTLAIYLSKILVGILIGRSIMEKLWENKKDSLVWAMIIGVLIVWFITSLPLIGWLLGLLFVWWGLGGIWLFYKNTE